MGTGAVNVGREVKRVPLDFDHPLKKVWYGYQIIFCHEEYAGGCERCREFARIMGIPAEEYKGIQVDNPCPDWKKYFKVDPPEGKGYQLWETTTEGAPISPVFKTLEELAEWCEEIPSRPEAGAFSPLQTSRGPHRYPRRARPAFSLSPRGSPPG